LKIYKINFIASPNRPGWFRPPGIGWYNKHLEIMEDIERKADHIYSLIKAAEKAGIKVYVHIPNLLN